MSDNPIVVTDLELLHQVCEPVNSYEEGKAIVDQLVEVARKFGNNIVGLSAPQIGIQKRVFIIISELGHSPFVNPVLKKVGKKTASDIESCFSVPGKEFRVRRHRKITIRDDVHGVMVLRDYAARVWQHEFDHLDGKTLVDTGDEI